MLHDQLSFITSWTIVIFSPKLENDENREIEERAQQAREDPKYDQSQTVEDADSEAVPLASPKDMTVKGTAALLNQAWDRLAEEGVEILSEAVPEFKWRHLRYDATGLPAQIIVEKFLKVYIQGRTLDDWRICEPESWVLRRLVVNITRRYSFLKQLPSDYLSILWFSQEGIQKVLEQMDRPRSRIQYFDEGTCQMHGKEIGSDEVWK